MEVSLVTKTCMEFAFMVKNSTKMDMFDGLTLSDFSQHHPLFVILL